VVQPGEGALDAIQRTRSSPEPCSVWRRAISSPAPHGRSSSRCDG